jgi:regulator of sigma E protease
MTGLFEGLVTIVLFLLILGVAVVIHELGHFFVARLAGVHVLEFGIGFPPRAKVLRDTGDTIYSLNWLPIGGFVKMEGEDGGDPSDPRSFASQPLAVKALILLAGVAMNLLLAFVIFTGITLTGDPAIGVTVPYVEPGSPAAQAGLVAGDVVERVDGRAFGAFGSVTILDELKAKAGRTVTLHVKHADGGTSELAATLRTKAEIASGKGALGIGRAGNPVSLRTTEDRIRYPVGDAIRLGTDRTIGATRLILAGVGQLLSDIVNNPTEPPLASGPVGIASQIGDVFWTLGPVITLYLAGVLSANLAVINILPFPPLDGGRLLVLVLKKALGTRLSLRTERLTYFVGFAVLFAFLIWVTAFDVARQFGGSR